MSDLKNVREYIPVYSSGNKESFVQSIRDAVEGFPENATFCLSVEDDYDDAHYARIEVNYKRPETPKEFAQRKAREIRQDAYERRQYETLRKKFEK